MMAETDLKKSGRVVPLIASVPLMLLAVAYASIMAMLGWHHGDPDWRGILAGFPFVGLWFYGSLVMLVEKWHLDVDANGVKVYYQPLPCFATPRDFARAEIAGLMFDRIHVAKEGTSWRIGVRLADGRQVLLPNRYGVESVARDQLAAIQTALSSGVRPELPVGSFFTPATKRDWGAARAVLIWGGAFLSAIVWGLAIEISRYKYS